MATSARLKTYQLKRQVAVSDVQQHEIGHRAVDQAVDAVADRAADDEAERQAPTAASAARASQIHSSATATTLSASSAPLPERALLLEPAVADAGVPGQHEVDERRDLDGARAGQVEDD